MQLSPVASTPRGQVVKPVIDTSPIVARVEVNPLPVLNRAEKPKSLVSIPALADSVLRAGFRFVEATVFSNPITSTIFRLGSEVVRHGTTGTIREAIDNKPVTREVWVKSVRSAVENTLGRIAFNTNVSGNPADGSIKSSTIRVLKGFGNWVVRVGYRLALVALDVMDPSELEPETLLDESVGKSFSRALCLSSDNAVVAIGSRIAEQVLIHAGLEHLPMQTWISAKNKTTAQEQSAENSLLAV